MEMTSGKAAKPVKEAVPKGAWAILIAVWIVAIAAPLNMFKPATISVEIIQALSIPGSSYGWIMSVFSIMGLILAFPATGLVYRFGLKKSLAVSVVSLFVGSLIGALSTSFEMLLVSRVIEGCGMGFIGVAGPTAISLWFPKSRQGFAVAVFQTWMPLGTLITMNLAPVMAASMGWKSVWWLACAYCVVAFIVLMIFFKEPSKEVMAATAGKRIEDVGTGNKFAAFKNPSLWILCIMFLVFALTTTGTTSSYWSLYLREVASIDASVAAFAVSLCTVLGAVGIPFGGWLSDKLGTRKWMIIAAWVVVLVFLWFAFSTTDLTLIYVIAIVNGFCQGWIPAMVQTSIPEILEDPSQNAMGMGLMNVFRNGGNILGGMALGYFVGPFGWSLGSHILCLPPIIIVVALMLIITRKTLR